MKPIIVNIDKVKQEEKARLQGRRLQRHGGAMVTAVNMVIIVIRHVPFEVCFRTLKACRKRFPVHKIILVDHGVSKEPLDPIEDWIDADELGGVEYDYWCTRHRLVALLQTVATLSNCQYFLLVDTKVANFPLDIRFDMKKQQYPYDGSTQQDDDEAPCMRLMRQISDNNQTRFVWQAIHPLSFATNANTQTNQPQMTWQRSMYIWKRSAFVQAYHESDIQQHRKQQARPLVTTNQQLQTAPVHAGRNS